VLQIGLGAASITRFLHRHRPAAHLVVAEIEPRVVAAARQHFRLPEDPARVSIEIADGAAYVAGAGRSFDWILVDGFDERGLAGALDTRAFYRRCRACLAPGGLVVANLLRRSRGSEASIARMAEAFDGRLLVLPVCASGNTIAIGATGAPLGLDRTDLRAAAEALRRATGLNLVRTVGRLAAAAPLSAPLQL
jgi:spermidine synthase